MCDPRDIGAQSELRAASPPVAVLGIPAAVSTPPAAEPAEFVAGWRPEPAAAPPAVEAGWPTSYLFDSVAGGVGFAERCHERHADLVRMALELVDGCGCDTGCPSCVGPAPARLNARTATGHLLRLASG
jgi:hypothetical protein